MDSGDGQWYWNASADPFGKEPAQWTPYSETDNNIIEQAFKSKASKVDVRNYVIHFEQRTQIHKTDFNKQRPVKRETK